METDFATWLRIKMAERNVSGKGLAGLLDVSHVAVGRWMNGKNKPTYQNCIKLAEFFDVPDNSILVLTGHRQPTHVAEAPATYDISARTHINQLLDNFTTPQLEALLTFLEILQ